MIKVINLSIAVKEPDGHNYHQAQYQEVIANALVDKLDVGIIDGSLNIFNIDLLLRNNQ